jgi:hypothetical protein
MRWVLYTAFAFLVGCQGVKGPRDRRAELYKSPADDPRLTIAEQEKRGRDRLAIPENSKTLVPRDYADFMGPANP